MTILGAIKIPDPVPWMEQALCAQSDPDAWFPEKGESVSVPRRVCQDCPVRVECLAYAVKNNERDGIWGGLTAYQRRGNVDHQDCPQCDATFIPTGYGQTFCSRSCSSISRHRRPA